MTFHSLCEKELKTCSRSNMKRPYFALREGNAWWVKRGNLPCDFQCIFPQRHFYPKVPPRQVRFRRLIQELKATPLQATPSSYFDNNNCHFVTALGEHPPSLYDCYAMLLLLLYKIIYLPFHLFKPNPKIYIMCIYRMWDIVSSHILFIIK